MVESALRSAELAEAAVSAMTRSSCRPESPACATSSTSIVAWLIAALPAPSRPHGGRHGHEEVIVADREDCPSCSRRTLATHHSRLDRARYRRSNQ